MKKLIPVGIILVLLLGAGAYVEKTKIHKLLNKVMGNTATSQTAANLEETTEMPVAASPTVSPTPVTLTDNNIYTIKADLKKGKYIADFAGNALYTYSKDVMGASLCTGTCLKLWPAYSSGATAQTHFPTNISVITRPDGSKQFAWKGLPLYYYAKDTKPGMVTGDLIAGMWHLVTP